MTRRELEEALRDENLVVYGGSDVQVSLFSTGPKKIPAGKKLVKIPSAEVYIDGMNYGGLDGHFGCFDVGPGLHRFELVGRFGRHGEISTDVRPARVREGRGLMIAIRSVECLSGVFFDIKEFSDLDEFLSYTGERLY